jgi:hypothetical protein
VRRLPCRCPSLTKTAEAVAQSSSRERTFDGALLRLNDRLHAFTNADAHFCFLAAVLVLP